MDFGPAEAVARSILYEGYLLYPYRRSSLKNERYWGLGGVVAGAPLHSECLLQAAPGAQLAVKLRFLQLDGETRQEREIEAGPWSPGSSPMVRRFQYLPAVEGTLEVSARLVEGALWKVTFRVVNEATRVDEPSTLHAAHILAGVEGGAFVSLIDPPESLRREALGCRNVGVWPVLAGGPGSAALLLCSPIILYDHPTVAPESPGDLFDGTEIDEILTLRILTLTDGERRELAAGDERVRALLARTEALGPDDLARMHGATRRLLGAGQPHLGAFRPGDRVRLRPRPRGDVLDLALAGRAATVAGIEQDLEGRMHLAVTIDDDPGRDLGVDGWAGHRFFFAPDEVERDA
jgi:hypothetical protein